MSAGRSPLSLLLVAAVLAVTGCRCDGGGTGSTTAGFRTETRELDFGKTLVDAEVIRELSLQATGREEVTVVLTTTGPFRAPESAFIVGAGSTRFSVVFTAPEGVAEGVLTLTARGESFDIPLRGRGVRPLDCALEDQCKGARFDLESESCVEFDLDEGTVCVPDSLCLEDGQCREGACVGTPRACDDNNACTQDACSPEVGCVNLDVSSTCPASSNPCDVPTCNPTTGCGFRTADDGLLCGSADCQFVNLCAAGACTKVPTPDGLVCSPATPCQGEGRCASGTCVRPDAGAIIPAWSVPLGDAPADVARQPGRLRSLAGNVYFEACGLQSRDGGCGLVSYTSNGFLRFNAPLHGPSPLLQGVAPWAAVVTDEDALSAYVPGTGALLWSLPLADLPAADTTGAPRIPRGGVALEADGGMWLAASFGEWVEVPAPDAGEPDPDAGMADPDGGMADPDAGPEFTFEPYPHGVALYKVAPDGGVMAPTFLPDAGFGSQLARGGGALLDGGDNGTLWVHADGAALHQVSVIDGSVVELGVYGGSALSAVWSGEGAGPGGAVVALRDGGVVPLVSADPDAGETPVDFEVLHDGASAFSFFRACREPQDAGCGPEGESTLLRVTGLDAHSPSWEARILPGHVEGKLVEAALTAGLWQGGVMTLTEAAPMTGERTDVQLFIPSGRALICPLDGAPKVEGALFERELLYALVNRNGQLRLEAYALPGIDALRTGWPRPNGTSGRRESGP